ncbi:ankyrin repeat domain-containing protein [Streptomyces bauhiniae]|uniref:Ankyrin repeat domain-containing protein n=1 Tax=Streptomyces bauhiniae TaxID=2340725 RepID=A0A7K3QZV6_9ACTN|nr:ankyrin repeat domain-containing protein [Streptomyces bauhiniae]NEB95321.1 ankyrin repeat domain-containing protein [Streptomyces bauhiniae]
MADLGSAWAVTESPWTPAHQAIEDGDIDTFARLLDSGADPNEKCCGVTLLIHAIDYEADTAIQSSSDMSVAFTAVVLAYGASPHIPNEMGVPPGEFAQDYGHMLAKRLIERFS